MTLVDASIVAVTVYPGQARVTRRASVITEAGVQRVEIGGLPAGLVRESVRVSGRGDAAVLGVDVGVQRNPRSPEAGVEELRERVETARAAVGEVGDALAVEGGRVELLSGVGRRAGGAFAKALAARELEVVRVAGITDALGEQLAEVLARKRELVRRRERAEEQAQAAERELEARRRQRVPDRRVVAVDLDVRTAGSFDLEVSYLVDDAQWASSFDIRVQGERLTLTWHAEITQNTGEDWPDCELALSTARPANSVRLPEPQPWFLDRRQPPAMLPAMAVAGAAPGGPPEPGIARSARVFAKADALPAPMHVVEHGATATTYRPVRQIAVPSDATAHRTTVAEFDLSATVDHITAPAQGPEAYLRATAVNTSEHTLRPGRASVFHESEFVGATQLEVWAPGEEVELNLGVDDRIRVERELVRRSAGKVVIGSAKRRDVEYRITVGNYGRRPTKVTVLDQIPVSRDDGIVVKDVTCRPNPLHRTDLGELTWQLPLDPNATAEISIGFRVDTARGVELEGWRE